MAPYRYPVFAFTYFRIVRSQPRNTMVPPTINPNKIPSLTFFIKTPNTTPSTIATRKAISPLRIPDFFSIRCVGMKSKKLSSYSMQ